MPSNQAPYFPEGSQRTVSVSPGGVPEPLVAVDPDGDVLAYTVVAGTLPDGLVLKQDGTWSGGVLGLQEAVVTVRACDPLDACTTLRLTLLGAVLPDTSTIARADTKVHLRSLDQLWVVAMLALAFLLADPRRLTARRPRA